MIRFCITVRRRRNTPIGCCRTSAALERDIRRQFPKAIQGDTRCRERGAGIRRGAAAPAASPRSRRHVATRKPAARLDIGRQSRNTLYPRPIDRPGGVQAMISKVDILILTALALSFVLGVYLFFTGHREQGIFAATWVVAILCFGIYCKLLCQRR
jgi:hypothetical protein